MWTEALKQEARSYGLDPDRNYLDSMSGEVRDCLLVLSAFRVLSDTAKRVFFDRYSETSQDARPPNRRWND